MKINNIKINNLFSYKGTIEFDLTGKSTVSIIVGSNGFGKTSFINSLKISLHGITRELLSIGETRLTKWEYVSGNKEKHFSGILNRAAAIEGENNCGIVLTFIQNGQSYILTRSFKLNPSGFTENLEIININQNDECYKNEDAQDFINKIISPELAKFFFFDGEKVQDIANFSNDEFCKMLENVLELDVYDQIIADYLKLKREYVKDTIKDEDLKDKYSLASKMQDDKKQHIIKLEQNIKNTKFNLKESKKDRTEAKNKIKKIDSEFKDVLKVQEEKFVELKNEKEKKLFLFNKISMSCLPLLLNRELGLKTEFDILNNYYDSNYIPIEILKKKKIEFMDLVNQRIKEGKEIESLFDSVFFAENKGVRVSFVDTSKAEFQYKSLDLNVIAFHALLDDLILIDESIATQKNLLCATRLSIKENELSLSSLLLEQEKIFTIIANNEVSIEQDEKEINYLEIDIDDLEKMIHKLSRVGHKEELQMESIKTCEKIIKTAQKAKVLIKSEKRASLEKIVNEKFNILIKDGYDANELRIDENFSINIFDKQGKAMDILSSSSGQKQIIATSLIWAISCYIDSEIPMTIDTPLGRLDTFNQELLINNFFPNCSSQVIILPTPSEIKAPGFKEIMEDASVFELSNNGTVATVKTIRKAE